MVKNEECSILQTLESCAPFVSHVRVLDTGSTDSTLHLVDKFSLEHPHIDVGQRVTEFVNFEVSRNELLQFCDEDSQDMYKFVLLMDSNDELIGGDILLRYLKSMPDTVAAIMLRQRWIYSAETSNVYFNVRVVRHRAGWRYKGVVHEYISGPGINVNIADEKITIQQDRRRNAESSATRHRRDYQLLMAEHKRMPMESRTLFYLAQTCHSIGRVEEAYFYYNLRVNLPPEHIGFYEEVFQSYVQLGECARALRMDHSVAIAHWMRALEKIERAEPACRIAEFYLFHMQPANYPLAYAFAKYACQLDPPTRCILFVDECDYTYTRYHLAGIAAYYVKDYDFGRAACQKAIDARNKAIDIQNLAFYKDKTLSLFI